MKKKISTSKPAKASPDPATTTSSARSGQSGKVSSSVPTTPSVTDGGRENTRRDKTGLSTDAKYQKSATLTPHDLLLLYQKEWSEDPRRFKIGLMARQVGKDFSSGDEGVRDLCAHELEGDKVDWLIGAPSERQALESLGKWKDFTTGYKFAIADIIEERDGPEALLKSSQIIYPNGSRAIAVPGKPETVRGFSANILLTECDFFDDLNATWAAMLPSITNPLRGGVKKVRLISTPNAVGSKFHEIWTKNYLRSNSQAEEKIESRIPAHILERIDQAVKAAPTSKGLTAAEAQMDWACHFVDIYRAVRDGLPVNLYEIYAGLDDPDAWAQEFECQFLDAASVLLPYDLIALCESIEATEAVPFEYWLSQSQFPIDMGIDFGRKRDLTVAWSAEAVADLQITKEVLCLEKMPTPEQVEILTPRIKRARRVCLDYTGPGIGLGDYLVKAFGEWRPEADLFGKIELITFSLPVKQDLFSKQRMAFERRSQRVPISRVIREDLHSVHRVVTAGGNVTYKAPHSPDGHADRSTANALCIRAGSNPATIGRAIVFNSRHNQILAERRERDCAG